MLLSEFTTIINLDATSKFFISDFHQYELSMSSSCPYETFNFTLSIQDKFILAIPLIEDSRSHQDHWIKHQIEYPS